MVLRRAYRWVRVVVTLALVAYLVWYVRSQAGTLRLHLARPPYMILALGCAVLGMIVSAWLWHILIPPASRIPFRQLLGYYLSSFVWNNFLPGGLGGDMVRVVALRNTLGQTDVAINSVLMARILGLWSTVLLASAASFSYAWRIGWQVSLPLVLLSWGSLCATACGTAFLLGAPMSMLTRRLSARLLGWHTSLRAYRRQPIRILQALGLTFVIQLCAIAINTLVAQSLNLTVTSEQLLLSLPLINLTVLVPVSLGGFGVREGAYVYLLGLVGVAATDALLLSLSVYALMALVAAASAGICVFLISLWRPRLKTRDH